jgi:DNA-binding Lrp family transcriptional regulator
VTSRLCAEKTIKKGQSKLDPIDIQILKSLNENARKSSREIAKELGVATGTVYSRIKKLTDEKVIKDYVPILDASKVGFELTALILLQVDGKFLIDVEKNLAALDDVYSVYDITGDYDVALIARFRDRASLNKFIKSVLTIPHIKRTVTNVVLNIVKEDARIKF